MTLSFPYEGNVPERQVLAIGDFDGIHLGHQEVIRRAVRTAREAGVRSAVMTFDPHPRAVLGRPEYDNVLTPLAKKLPLFEKLGVDYTYIVRFDRFFSERSANEFVNGMLLPMNTESVIVGFDFRFGHKGTGTADTLVELGRGAFSVEVVRPFSLDGEKVSSTAVRECLASGEPDRAASLLGRSYTVSGVVVEGDKRGRTIGFPTANVQLLEPYVCPKRGVYAVRVLANERWYDGVMNIGFKPTFTDAGMQTLEAHLFDFSGDLYGKTVTISFVTFIREERKFGSVDELIAQIRSDSDTARLQLAASVD